MTGPLQALLAREAIRELLARYCFLLDGHELAALGALFTEDGIWTSRNGEAQGPSRIAAFLGRLVPPPGPATRRKHLTTNIVIDLDADGEAGQVVSNFLVIRDSAAGPVVAVAGTYRDLVARSGERWLFRHRQLLHDIAGESGLNPVRT